MLLTKHNALGNEFLVALVEFREQLPEDPAALARAVCDRETGAGADGLIFGLLLPPGNKATARMLLYNADGSFAEMSGNGVCCLADAVLRHQGKSEGTLRFSTDAGERSVTVKAFDANPNARSDFVQAEVTMGKVHPGPKVSLRDVNKAARFFRAKNAATANVGNPHLVVQVRDVEKMAKRKFARLGARLGQLGGGLNVEFISKGSASDTIDMRVWERGVGVTQACGTGACAAAYWANKWGLCEALPLVEVTMSGGTATVQLDPLELAVQVEYMGQTEFHA